MGCREYGSGVRVSATYVYLGYFMPVEHERRVLCCWERAFRDEDGSLG